MSSNKHPGNLKSQGWVVFPTTLAVGPTRTGYQNAVSAIILGGALDKVAAAMSKVSSAGVMCLQVVDGTPAKCGAMVPVAPPMVWACSLSAQEHTFGTNGLLVSIPVDFLEVYF